MRKIKILQFPFSANNGITTYATNNWMYLDKNKFECDFAVVRKSFNPAWEAMIVKSGGGIKKLLYEPDRNEEDYAKKLHDLIADHYDAVHLHTSFWKQLTVEQISVACKVPKIIVHSHNTGIDSANEVVRETMEKIHYKLREQFSSSLATDFCACSNKAANWLFGEHIPTNQVKILKNAIEINRFLFDQAVRSQYRRNLGLENCFVIGHIGRFGYQKNHEFLIELFQKVCGQVPNARLLLIGEGPLKNEVSIHVQRAKITEKVLFMGQRDDTPQLLQAMDVFCLPSRFEGFPLVLVEAQTSGLICLASDQVDNEVCITKNLIQLPLDMELWSDAVTNIAEGYERENMCEAVTEAGYDIKRQIKLVEKLYLE